MGMLLVQIDEQREVHVKDNVYSPAGWHLWCSLYVDGEYVTSAPGPIVADIEDATLERAGREWYDELRMAG